MKQAEGAQRRGVLRAGKGRDVFLSTDEGRAWQIAHRLRHLPMVVVVDVRKAVQGGVTFRRGRNGMFIAPSLPLACLVNLQPAYQEQHSAGGFLIRRSTKGLEVCLVACRRRSGKSWEIAKGKMEPGETPLLTAIRELQEEMGFEAEMRMVEPLGMVRYAFTAPHKQVRLKAMHLFLLEATPTPVEFHPAQGEGIVAVEWVGLEEARKRIRHSSLRPVIRELCRRYTGRNPETVLLTNDPH